MKIAICQLNPTIGAIRENTLKLLDYCHRANQLGADLVIAPELVLCGYPPKDLLFREELLSQVEDGLAKIAKLSPLHKL